MRGLIQVLVTFSLNRGEEYNGKRSHLKKTKEELKSELVGQACERCDYSLYGGLITGYVVYFHIDKVISLAS